MQKTIYRKNLKNRSERNRVDRENMIQECKNPIVEDNFHGFLHRNCEGTEQLRNELRFALLWIALYVVIFSLSDGVSQSIGIAKIVTAPVSVLMTVIVYLWISKNGLKEKYGLCGLAGSAKQYLYFLPLVFLATTNIWYGFKMNLSVPETMLYILSMLCVGFLEEIFFRGFLFQAMCKSNVKRAIVISSLTFGLGHIVNLLNGRDIPETLMQICYAVAVGFLFTIIFYKGKSLWPCIITHSVINSLSVFANEDMQTVSRNIISCLFLCVVSLLYAVYILKKSRKEVD